MNYNANFFGFRNNIFFTEQGRQPNVQLPTCRTRSLYLRPQVTEWPSYTPQTRSSLFIAFYDSQGYGGGILTRFHTRSLGILQELCRNSLGRPSENHVNCLRIGVWVVFQTGRFWAEINLFRPNVFFRYCIRASVPITSTTVHGLSIHTLPLSDQIASTLE
jgi:hypothetical protein